MSIKKLSMLMMLALIFVMPSISNAESIAKKLTDKDISSIVKKAVKEHGSVTAPMIVETNTIDPEDGARVSIYVIPESPTTLSSASDISIKSTTPISQHIIPQGTKMIYSKPDGQPWTVETTTSLHMSVYIQGSNTNWISSTNMRLGHLNGSTGSDIASESQTGTWYGDPLYRRYFSYSHSADATKVRFFITNNSAADVSIQGYIDF